MSELTQRIQRLMSPEAQDSNSREFNVTISILNDIREDLRDVAGKVDKLRDTVSDVTGDLKEARANIGRLWEGVRENTQRIEKLQDGKKSKWTGSGRPWNGPSNGNMSGGIMSPNIISVLKYVGIVLGSFFVGMGSMIAAWQQITAEQKTTYVPVPPAHMAPAHEEPNHDAESDVSVDDEWRTAQ